MGVKMFRRETAEAPMEAPPTTPLAPAPTRTRSGGLTAREAGGAVLDSLLEAEQDLRQIAEQAVQDLSGALRLAAYTFAGEAFEEAIRSDQVAVENWSADEWIAFFQKAAPVGQGWNDAKVLAKRLTEMTAERDALLTTVAEVKTQLALKEEQLRNAASPISESQPATPPVATVQEATAKAEQKRKRDPVKLTEFRWPNVPTRPPAKYARQLSSGWKRKGMALALIASGISLRIEAQRFLAWRENCTEKTSSIRKVFERLEKVGLLEGECVRVHTAKTKFLWLTKLGQRVAEICRFDLRETDYQRMLRLHGGKAQKKHAAETATFAYQARKRGFMAAVMPDVGGPAEPDVIIARKEGETPVYVEVETGDKRDPKWQNMVDLQGFVAVCSVTEIQQERIIAEIKELGLPGRATNLEALIQDKEGKRDLWLEEWE